LDRLARWFKAQFFGSLPTTQMIIGNQRSGRKLLALVIVIAVAILLTAAFLMRRRRMAPQNEPPLHSAAPAGAFPTVTAAPLLVN
jgi:cytoskeletal protein RodZ